MREPVRTSAVAIAFGAFMLCTETCLHAESILHARTEWADLPIHDWLAGGFLIAAGVASKRDWPQRVVFQAAAWAFMLSLLVRALFAWIEEWVTPPDASEWGISESGFVVIVAVLAVVALASLIFTVRTRQP